MVFDRETAEICKECGKKAVMYNSYNKVIQCHNCGVQLEFDDFETLGTKEIDGEIFIYLKKKR